MSNLLKSKFLMGVMVVAVMFVGFAAVSVDSASADCSITMTLKVGSTGSEVSCLQTKVGATADGSFGPMTKASVMAFQSNAGLSADGVVGPMTRAVLNGVMGGSYPAGCSSSTGYSTTTGASCASSSSSLPAGCSSTSGYSPTTGAKCSGGSTSSSLDGTDGTIQLVTELTQYSNEEVGEGSKDEKVLGFDLEVSNDGDIDVQSIKVSFDPTGNTGSDDLDDYLESVSVWMGDEEVGSADADDFSQDSNDLWTRTISLSGAVVEAGETEQFYVAVTAVGNLDSGDISSTNDSWTVDVESVRYEDGAGVVTTDTDGEINGMDVPISFVTFSAASDTELKFSTHSDSPEAGIVVASNTGTTDDVVLLKGEIELEGDSNVVIDELPITFSPTTSNFNVIASSIKIKLGGEEYSESVPSIAAAASATITFDNLDFEVEAGDTVTFEVIAEIADTDDFTAGSTVTASFTSTNRSAMDVENEQGDNLASDEKSGTVNGEALEFRANGIKVDLVGTPTAAKSASDTDNGDTGTFTIKFKVTAVGDDMYVSSTVGTSGAANNLYAVYQDGTATTAGLSALLQNNTDTDVTSGLFLIEEGESETFTLTVVRRLNETGDDGLYYAALTSIKWDDEAGDTTPDNNYTTNLDEFRTDPIGLD